MAGIRTFPSTGWFPAFPETDHLFLNGLVGTEMKIGYPEIDLISLWYSMIAFSFNADDFHM